MSSAPRSSDFRSCCQDSEVLRRRLCSSRRFSGGAGINPHQHAEAGAGEDQHEQDELGERPAPTAARFAEGGRVGHDGQALGRAASAASTPAAVVSGPEIVRRQHAGRNAVVGNVDRFIVADGSKLSRKAAASSFAVRNPPPCPFSLRGAGLGPDGRRGDGIARSGDDSTLLVRKGDGAGAGAAGFGAGLGAGAGVGSTAAAAAPNAGITKSASSSLAFASGSAGGAGSSR